VTEEEAKTKWCPQTRIHVLDDVEYNNRQNFDAGRIGDMCITSNCMMWVEDTSVKVSTGAMSVCGGHCGLVK